jgi:hypothetical protein
MEYVVTANRPFEEIETQAISALEQQGFGVQRSFSLHSAAGTGGSAGVASPGYSVLLLYTPGTERQLLGLVTLYERQGRTVIGSRLTAQAEKQRETSRGSEDLEADLVAALLLGGLDLCVDPVRRTGCIGPEER